jgi:acyl-CoA thioester hydrolase
MVSSLVEALRPMRPGLEDEFPTNSRPLPAFGLTYPVGTDERGRMDESKDKTVERESPEVRNRYPHFLTVPTRWMDNDVYGHVNNVVYYSYFDTVVNEYLISTDALDIEMSPVIGLVVETQCRFFKPITFPDVVYAGLRVARLGRSSVRYEIGLFKNDDDSAAAQGHFVHVYVERESRTATALPPEMRAALEKILVSG